MYHKPRFEMQGYSKTKHGLGSYILLYNNFFSQ